MAAIRTTFTAAALSAALLAPAAPAQAYDTGPHAELSTDALTAEGFGPRARQIVQVNNWFVDLYEQAEKNPASGHAAWWKRLLALVPISEKWSKRVIDAADRSHFDSTTTSLGTTAGVTAEWERLQRAVWRIARRARDTNDPLLLLTVLGASIHQVQDFYTHTNWVEPGDPAVTGGEGPGWAARGFGSHPTWFDVPAAERGAVNIYAGGTDGHDRSHGDWNTNGNQSLVKGMAKDWPGRPLYLDSATTSYFATRQWIRAVRSWVDDEAFWRRAQRFSTQRKQLNRDVQGSFLISLYSGHWQGQGEPIGSGNKGPGGSLTDLTLAIKRYFQRGGLLPRGKTVFRKKFERTIRQMAAPNPVGEVGPVPSSQDMQRDTQLVRLQILSMRGLGLGDPGPDKADMYVRARIDGQPFHSAVIHGKDRFFFGKPNHPFTFLKAVPRGGTHNEPVERIEARIKTCDARFAGTDDSVYLRINSRQRFKLDKRLYNDFERGDRDTYSVPIDAATRAGLDLGDISRIQIEKSRDGVAGGWKLCGVRVTVNGRLAYSNERINRWLEDDKRTWRAGDFRGSTNRGAKLPVWFELREDDRVYGSDDDGDINRYDRRRDIAVGYTPGTIVERLVTGGKIHGGRLGDGDRAQVRYRLDTLTPTPIPPRPPVVTPPVVTPPTLPPVVDPGPSTPPPAPKPDLVITAFRFNSITVQNQGPGDAGPFRVDAGGVPLDFTGLAAGETETRKVSLRCQDTHTATVDVLGQVDETDESNNTRVSDVVIC